MGAICDDCRHQQKRYDGVFICQYSQSMRGEEALSEYVVCDDVDGCRYHRPTTFPCSKCTEVSCYAALVRRKCPRGE